MKKIILGCAAVLLSLGLLAGCNNEESDKAVSIKVDTAATVVVGEDLALPYTVEPEKAKVEVFNDHEEYVTASADVGLISLTGVAAGNATITLVGTYKKYTEANVSIAVSVVTKATEDTGPGEEEPGNTGDTEPGLPEIELVVDPISEPLIAGGDPVQVTYSVNPPEAEDGIDMVVADTEIATVAYLEPDEEDPDDSVEEAGWYLTPVAQGETTLTVTASLEEYETASVEVAIKVHAEGWEPLTEQENYTLTFTFAAEVPTYADAYITGCLEGGTNTDSDWVNYEIGNTGLMTVSEDKYSLSYTFTKVAVGDIAINIYFEYNGSSTYHEAATEATWAHNVFEGDDTWVVISDDEEVSETVTYVDLDPSEDVIRDKDEKCELTVAIKDSSSNGFQEGYTPSFYHWVSGSNPDSAFVSMTQGAIEGYTTESDYYFVVETTGVSDGGGSNYCVYQGDKFTFRITVTNGNNKWNDTITIANEVSVPAEVNAYTDSRDIVVTPRGTNCDSALVVLEFDYSACQTTSSSASLVNNIVTSVTYVSNWKAE